MAVVLVQSTKKVVTGVNNTTLAYSSSVTAGNFLAVTHAHWEANSRTITTPTDTLSHTYVGMTAEQNSGVSVHLRSFYVANCSGGANTVTFDISTTDTGDLTVVVAEFSGVVTVSPLDQTNVGAGTGTAVATSATATTAQADELLWGGLAYEGNDTTILETTGYSIVQENEGGSTNMPIGTEYKVVAATGAYTANWTLGLSRTWIAHIATFKAVVAGGASVVPIIMNYYRRRW